MLVADTKNGKKIKRNKTIDRLSPERRQELDLMMVKGNKPLTEMARIVQEEWGELCDIQHNSLVKRLTEYRKREIHGHLYTEELRPDGTRVVTRPAELQREIDVHQDLIELLSVSKTRLTRLLIVEAETWREKDDVKQALSNLKVSEAVRREIDQYSSLLKQMSDLKFDMGLLSRVPKKIKQETTYLNQESAKEQKRLAEIIKAGDQQLDADHEVFAILEKIESKAITEVEASDDTGEGEVL